MGKGGTGKTTIAAALGMAAARRGRRTVVVEVAEQQRLLALFGRGARGHKEVQLDENLFGLSIDPKLAMEEWLRHQLRSGTLAGLLGGSRIFQLLTAAAPGVSELVTMGKIWDLAQLERRVGGTRPYDIAIVDSPATGHGVALLRAPRTYAQIARVGPIAKQATHIHRFLADPAATGVVAVALPEEMPVNETIDLRASLRSDMGMEIDNVVVNAVLERRFALKEAKQLAALDGKLSAKARAAVSAALAEHTRSREQLAEIDRLRRAVDVPVVTLPFLFEPDLGAAQVEELSQELESQL